MTSTEPSPAEAGDFAAKEAEEEAPGKFTIQLDAERTGKAYVTHADPEIEIDSGRIEDMKAMGWCSDDQGVLQFGDGDDAVQYELTATEPGGSRYKGRRLYRVVMIEARHLERLLGIATTATSVTIFPGENAQGARAAAERVLKGYSEVGPK